MTVDPAAAIAGVYDEFASTYDRNRNLFDLRDVLSGFRAHLPATGALLDLGCGAGEPVAAAFVADGWEATGVDLSESMLRLAHRHVPQLRTVRADIREVEFPAESFDAVTAVYSLFHVPWPDHPGIFGRIHNWLRPGGAALFTYATPEYTGSEEFSGTKVFMGRELFYSHTTEAKLRGQLAEAKLAVLDARRREIGGETFLWVTVQRD